MSVRLTISSSTGSPTSALASLAAAAVSEDPFGADIPQGPLDQTGGTVAILDICRDYLEREVTFGVDEGVALNALIFLARIITDRINGDPPFRSLSRPACR